MPLPVWPSMVWPYRLAAACLILGSAALRFVYLACDCPLDLAPDEAHYWDWSRHLDLSYYSKGPLVAWIISVSRWLLGSWSVDLVGSEMLAVRVPAVIFGSLLLASLYVLSVQVFGREGLALAVVGVALTMPLIAAGSSLMTIDSPYTCLWGWALVVGHRALFANRAEEEKRRRGEEETGRSGDKETRRQGDSFFHGLPYSSSSVPHSPSPCLLFSSSPLLPLSSSPRLLLWGLLGLLVGVGILAKYTMVLFVPFLGLFLLATPNYRPVLRRPGFWIMALVGALCCTPILVWNAQHDWVTLRHASGHAGLQSGRMIHWLGPVRYLATQFGILLGFWFVVWGWALWRRRPGCESRPELLYLWWLSAPMFVFFGLFSFKNGGGEPNWPVTAYLAGLVLAVGVLAEELAHASLSWRRWALGGALGFGALGLVLSVLLHRMVWVQPLLLQIAGPATTQRPLPLRTIDPTVRLRGWRTLASEVDTLTAHLGARGIEPVLAAGSWSVPGELGVYCAGQPTVYSLGLALGDRHSQYDLWRPNPLADLDQFRGRTFIVVGVPAQALKLAFDRVEATRTITHFENGQPVAQWWITIGHGYRGFPSKTGESAF